MNEQDFHRTTELLGLDGWTVFQAGYVESGFGSWTVETTTTGLHARVVWDGRDGWLIVQERHATAEHPEWLDLWIGKTPDVQTPELAVTQLRQWRDGIRHTPA